MILDSDLQPLPDDAPLKLAPTDIAQFIRLDQCQRYLRLRLTERARKGDFIRRAQVSPQDPPPLMMLGGTDFEAEVYARIRARRSVRDMREGRAKQADDNGRIREMVDSLSDGNEVVLVQPKLRANIGRWRLSGDADILRLSRDASGTARALIVDVKSSALSKVEHRLQVAFYAKLLRSILHNEADGLSVDLGVLYRGDDAAGYGAELEHLRAAARTELGSDLGYLDVVDDPAPFLDAVDELVFARGSTAERIAAAAFESLPFHLTYRCDWCRYNPWCMKWAAQTDDLSLVPFLTENDKGALHRCGVTTAQQLSIVKTEGPGGSLVTPPEQAELAARLSVTWPLSARLDELIQRARRYRGWKGDPVKASTFMSHRGYGTLPFCGPDHNPNLVNIYVDAQHDGQSGHLYLLGALVAAAEHGTFDRERRASVVRMSARPPLTIDDERDLLLDWIEETLAAVVRVAAPDENGDRRAPIHLIFFNRFDQNLFLDALARHAGTILSATPLYDFVTQLAAFDSPVATFLVDEVRELRNYPMLSQSLQSLATFRKFDWNQPRPFRKLFRERLFDYVGKWDEGDPTAPEGSPWYTSRSRFDSQIPLEYAYAAWDALPAIEPGAPDPFGAYRAVTPDDLVAFQARRLEALEYVASDFPGNKDTSKTPFSLPDLDQFEEKGESLAQALSEFVLIERFVELAGWRSARLAPPERRMQSGISLVTRYLEEDQDPGVAALMRDAIRRRALRETYEAAYRAEKPDAKQVRLPKDQNEASKWSINGVHVRLRIEVTGLDCELQEALDLSTLREQTGVIISPRWTYDTRLPEAERRPIQPTPKQLLRGLRGDLTRIDIRRDDMGRATEAFAVVRVSQGFPPTLPGGFVFGCMKPAERPFDAGEQYVLDADVNDWTGHYAKKIADGIAGGGRNELYARLIEPRSEPLPWPDAAVEGQRRFLAGFEALAKIGDSVTFEPSKRAYIAEHGGTPTLLVQGPPGTGKSFTTAYALFARMQGAMAAGFPFRIVVSCHTHKAIDVVIQNLVQMRETLERVSSRHPALFTEFFDERLLAVPIFRARPNGPVSPGVVELKRKSEDGGVDGLPVERFLAQQWAVVGATPNAVHGLLSERWGDDVFGQEVADCLVLDEASQLSLAVAVVSALPLKPDGQVIVVGDHRQMPPIIKHDWGAERRRTFQEFRAFESLFLTLLGQQPRPPLIQFEESFRLHRDAAAFLGQEIYRHDGITFHSRRNWKLAPTAHDDPFVDAVLASDHALVVVVHDEAGSQQSNAFERKLVLDLARPLYDERIYGTGDEQESDGFGVVVPHRAQRAAITSALIAMPDRVGAKPVIADTVERFQGDEREVIIVSATESDPSYLLTASGFLLEPRRLTVALSRAKRKLVLVAARSVFELFSPDEETFANAQLWKNLLRRTCTVQLWQGERDGFRVEVWGSNSAGARS